LNRSSRYGSVKIVRCRVLIESPAVGIAASLNFSRRSHGRRR